MKAETKTNNRLWQARHKCGLEQKQVARLLGHKNCDQISRYERGARMPGLRIALKLELIYHTPVSHLFPDHYQKYRVEIALNTSQSFHPLTLPDKQVAERLPEAHVCTYDNLMLKKKPDTAEIQAVNKHTIHLIERISDVTHRRRTPE